MRRTVVTIVLAIAFGSSLLHAAQQAPKPGKSGPPAASLATQYSGPLRFPNLRVLADERAAANNPDPLARAATWRYYYSNPFANYYYGCGGSLWYGGYGGSGYWGGGYWRPRFSYFGYNIGYRGWY